MSDARIQFAFADTHIGCKMALCPREGAKLDDGGLYMPSPFQLELLGVWDDAWGKWHPELLEKLKLKKWDLIFNGDGIDAVHHGGTTQWSHNLVDQRRGAEAIMRPVVERCRASGGDFYYIRGTEAHSGPSCREEEQLAHDLGAVPNKEGQYARWELSKYLGPGTEIWGKYEHHIKGGGSSWYETTQPHKEQVDSFMEAGRWDNRPPDYLVRAHQHKHQALAMSGMRGGRRRDYWIVLVPCWQGKTPFMRRGGGSQRLPVWGVCAIERTPDDRVFPHDYTRSPKREEPE